MSSFLKKLIFAQSYKMWGPASSSDEFDESCEAPEAPEVFKEEESIPTLGEVKEQIDAKINQYQEEDARVSDVVYGIEYFAGIIGKDAIKELFESENGQQLLKDFLEVFYETLKNKTVQYTQMLAQSIVYIMTTSGPDVANSTKELYENVEKIRQECKTNGTKTYETQTKELENILDEINKFLDASRKLRKLRKALTGYLRLKNDPVAEYKALRKLLKKYYKPLIEFKFQQRWDCNAKRLFRENYNTIVNYIGEYYRALKDLKKFL